MNREHDPIELAERLLADTNWRESE
ncbi:hypothetical protein PBI_JOSHKAYV_89 [Mycobacterium phage JoshKayV]|uniref:Uncharacterized protein n=1 Tax=Mycobacterium phage JoshKayV TaxID=2024294 RepID=A0A249XTY1_9CAUD|nr:hypothetical protein KIY86_gp18 [Mycobacterium phage JoshKayV]ASZ75428.1 hypothetical protein PBI_JOSHKAYV_89 [Mycobacterium phage JoshKayV]